MMARTRAGAADLAMLQELIRELEVQAPEDGSPGRPGYMTKTTNAERREYKGRPKRPGNDQNNPDMPMPMAEMEDSEGYWDAMNRGNGRGRSYINRADESMSMADPSGRMPLIEQILALVMGSSPTNDVPGNYSQEQEEIPPGSRRGR